MARYSEFMNLPLNELGDFAAGVFAPLAFLWLVLGYRRQGEELSASNESLRLQVSELRASFKLQQDNSQKQDRMLDPVLDMKWAGYYTEGAVQHGKFQLENLGYVCRHVRISYEDMMNPGSRQAPQLLLLLPEKTRSTMNGPAMLNSPAWRIHVSYIRVNGSSGKQAFMCILFPGRDPHVSLEPEFYEDT